MPIQIINIGSKMHCYLKQNIMKRKITCKNPECKQEIKKYKSSKRLYCDDTCKNRAHYIKRIEEEGHLIDMDKAVRKNYKILEKLKAMGLDVIEEQTLISHGFNFNANHKDGYILDENGKGIVVSRIQDIKFIIKDKKLIFKN